MNVSVLNVLMFYVFALNENESYVFFGLNVNVCNVFKSERERVHVNVNVFLL